MVLDVADVGAPNEGIPKVVPKAEGIVVLVEACG